MQYLIAIILFGLISVASAQDNVQGADPKFLQAAIQTLQAQRNRAMDEAASAEAQLAKAQQQIVDLQKQLDALKNPPSKK